VVVVALVAVVAVVALVALVVVVVAAVAAACDVHLAGVGSSSCISKRETCTRRSRTCSCNLFISAFIADSVRALRLSGLNEFVRSRSMFKKNLLTAILITADLSEKCSWSLDVGNI
jgi:hypothetical protein